MSEKKPLKSKAKKTTKKKTTKNKGGRPSKFPKGKESAIKKLVLMGATDNDLAEAFEVTEQTVNNWKKAKPEFFESLKDWKLQADDEVEKALYQRAIGYSCKDTKFATHEGKITETKQFDKNYPPDTAAAFIWLQNRKPDAWRREQPPEGASKDIAEALSEIADKLPG